MLARTGCYISQINKIASRPKETLLTPAQCVERIRVGLLAVNGRTSRDAWGRLQLSLMQVAQISHTRLDNVMCSTPTSKRDQ
jgi:hypothetical protein